jgi:hypothetical protein
MDAAADYAAAKLALSRTLPAYVSYRVVSHAGAGPFAKDEDQTIVVRTKDGTVVRGKPPSIQIGANSKEDYNRDVVEKPPFDPACYSPTSARQETFENRPVEALGLHETCSHDEDDGDFGVLFVDPQTHAPIAASGGNTDETVAVRVVQRYTAVAGFYMPSALDVSVKGSGWMSWLDVAAFEHFSDYVFSSAAP